MTIIIICMLYNICIYNIYLFGQLLSLFGSELSLFAFPVSTEVHGAS